MYWFEEEKMIQAKSMLRWGKDNEFMLRFQLSCLTGKSKALQEETYWKMIFLLDRYVSEIHLDLDRYYQALDLEQKQVLLIDFLNEMIESFQISEQKPD